MKVSTTTQITPLAREELSRKCQNVASHLEWLMDAGYIMAGIDTVAFRSVGFGGRGIKPLPLAPFMDDLVEAQVFSMTIEPRYDYKLRRMWDMAVYRLNPVFVYGSNANPFTHFLQGIFVEVVGRGIEIKLQDILNRYPTKSVLWVFVRVLWALRQVGLIWVSSPPLHVEENPHSLGVLYKYAAQCFFKPKIHVRFDFNPDVYQPSRRRVGWWVNARAASFLTLHEKGAKASEFQTACFYFTKKKTKGNNDVNTRIYIYKYPGRHFRLELVMSKPVNLAYSPHSRIIEQLNPMATIRSREHRRLNRLMKPILSRPWVHLADTDLVTEGEALYAISHRRNQHHKKLM